ncbi:MAG: redoxin domain-containing protein [bacterium]
MVRTASLVVVFVGALALAWPWSGNGAVGQIRPAPEISGDSWLNSPPLRLAGLRGKVVLVEFWTFACWNCRNVEPVMKRWHAQFKDRGLVVIGVHTPELEVERDPNNVAQYVREHGIAYPVALDGGFKTWKRYDNNAWPALYLIDANGNIVYTHVGEGDYDKTEQQIESALGDLTKTKAP